MKCCLLLVAAVLGLASGCRRRALPDSTPTESAVRTLDVATQAEAAASIRSWNLKSREAELVTVDVHRIPGWSELLLARCDYEDHWWGFFAVYGTRNGEIEWQAACDEPPTEQSILEVRAISLIGFEGPVIEVFGQTHMGNGSLYLYQLRDRKLHLLFETRAVDNNNHDCVLIEDGRFTVEYRDVDCDGHHDIILSGVLEFLGDDIVDEEGDVVEHVPPESSACREQFWWDRSQNAFFENPAYRSGFIRDWR